MTSPTFVLWIYRHHVSYHCSIDQNHSDTHIGCDSVVPIRYFMNADRRIAIVVVDVARGTATKR